MLIEFTVANFRSIQSPQTLSMVAQAKDKSLPGNVFERKLPGLTGTRFLKSAAIYGPNASGKSNVFKAARFMRDFVVDSAVEIRPGDPTGFEPFRLDPDSREGRGEFEAIFVHDGIRYQYGFRLDKERVWNEWLYAFPRGQAQLWFERDGGRGEWKFGPNLHGEKEALRRQTRANALFLSTTAQFNHEQLSKVYRWFHKRLRFFDYSSADYPDDEISDCLREKSQRADRINRMIRMADLGICRIGVREAAPAETGMGPGSARASALLFAHSAPGNGGEEVFGAAEESAGTLKYLHLLGKWLDAMEDGSVTWIDEIGACMHSHLIRNLVAMSNDPHFNSADAQLVFTTHDTSTMDLNLLRRDQIWFTEKTQSGATMMYPLTDYKPRNREALQKGYLAGRYGAIPLLEPDTHGGASATPEAVDESETRKA